MIEFRNVTKLYDSSAMALDRLNIKIEKAEFIFIVGASGSGKSTLLKLITKEEEPTSGKIIVNNVNLTQMKKRDIPYLRRTIGLVFQDFRLIEKMTVFENVAFAMNIMGAGSRSISKRVPYVLNLVGLEGMARRRPSELSGGEKQRVGLARALVNNPGMILADEPTGNIDPAMSYEIVDLLGKINKCGTTILMVTHDISIVKQFPFRVVEISEGKVVGDTQNRSDDLWL
ncbi:MAG: cell division ATP-binding protein FtsE [Oscillospiraceae bacterium]|jgi:cell division transport system ATP-binding protein|nr:cell division ATP-binding protein FtsE [Oscillospiraceae bacterium]